MPGSDSIQRKFPAGEQLLEGWRAEHLAQVDRCLLDAKLVGDFHLFRLCRFLPADLVADEVDTRSRPSP